MGITGIVHADLNNGLIAFYPFNGNANDESGNGNDGIVQGAILTKDRFGNLNQAYTFDGNEDYIDINNSEIFSEISSMTISAWFYSYTNQNDDNAIISKTGKTYAHGSYDWIFLEDGSEFYIGTTKGLKLVEIEEPTINMWHHAVGVVVSSEISTSISIYIDGNLLTSQDVDGSFAHTDDSIRIADYHNISHVWNGMLDNIRIYNRALSEDEIHQLYNEEANQNCIISDNDGDGVPDQLDHCQNTPQGSWVNSNGCRGDIRYTEEDMMNMVNTLLQWDINKDKQIGLIEAIQALRDTAGVLKPPQN